MSFPADIHQRLKISILKSLFQFFIFFIKKKKKKQGRGEKKEEKTTAVFGSLRTVYLVFHVTSQADGILNIKSCCGAYGCLIFLIEKISS